MTAGHGGRARLGALLEHAGDGIVLTTASGTIVHASPAAARMLGRPRDSLPGAFIGALPGFENAGPFGAAAAGAPATRRRIEPGGGRVLDVRIQDLLAVRDVAAIAFFIRDVTEEVAAELALRESEQRYRRLVENASDIIFQCDLDGVFTFVNRTASAVMGYSRDDLLGRHFTEFVREDHRERLVALYTNQRDQCLPDTYVEFPAVTRDGREVWIGQHVQVVTEGGRVVALQAVARDMTERRRVDEQLQQARRLEAIGTLAGGVAHDFNNLLQAIRGNAELAVIRLGADVAGSDLQTILDSSDRAEALVRQLLAFGQQQPSQPMALDVRDEVATICANWSSILRLGVSLETECDEPLRLVRFDRGQFEQVIVNLMLNARDAMPRGGRLGIAMRNVEPNADVYARMQIAPASRPFVQVAVTDTGDGMSEETLRHIFEPFFTTKEQGKGTGLGLSSVYGIVTQAGGHIEVESRLGEGTRFTVYLPAVVPLEAAGA